MRLKSQITRTPTDFGAEDSRQQAERWGLKGITTDEVRYASFRVWILAARGPSQAPYGAWQPQSQISAVHVQLNLNNDFTICGICGFQSQLEAKFDLCNSIQDTYPGLCGLLSHGSRCIQQDAILCGLPVSRMPGLCSCRVSFLPLLPVSAPWAQCHPNACIA